MSGGGDAAREWHRDVVEAAPVPVAVYDAEGRLRYANDAAVSFVNAESASEVAGEPAAGFVHPDDRGRIEDRIRRVVGDREPVEPFEARFLAVDGEEKHAVVAGAPVSYEGAPAGQAILNDVTERQRRERQLRRQRDRFELLFENLPSAVVHGVAEGGRPIVRRVNRRFEEVFGHDRDAVVGEDLHDFIVPEGERAAADRLSERILAAGRLQTDVRRETADGVREFLLQIVLEELDGGPPEGYAIYTDVTDQRRAERELARRNERLEEFASLVAHDLRNPLNVAKLHLEGVEGRGDDGGPGRAERALERMEAILENLLELARQDEAVAEPEPVDVAAVAGRAWEAVPTAEAEYEIRDTARVQGDPDRLHELFENLFRNAVAHAGEDVTVVVGTTADGFYVADDGPGIPPGRREDVLELGYSTDEDGTGFGLGIVRRIAEAHGWELDVAEAAAGGARFEFAGVETAPPT